MKCLIVSYCAGGAEIVSSWVQHNPQYQYQFILGGPARSIFERKLPSLKTEPIDKLSKIITSSDFVLTSTGTTDFEKKAIQLCKINNIKVISFLDYWSRYRERFKLQNEFVYPDEIWVGDSYALQLAKDELPINSIKLIENPYILDLLKEKNKFKIKNRNQSEMHILYLCQPFNEDFNSKNGETVQQTDTAAMEYFFQCLKTNPNIRPGMLNIRIRLHPTEKIGKYDSIANLYKNDFAINSNPDHSLVEDCVWSDWVVGVHTMGLVVALTLGSKAFHCIPEGWKPCVLPYREIKNFKDFFKQYQTAGGALK